MEEKEVRASDHREEGSVAAFMFHAASTWQHQHQVNWFSVSSGTSLLCWNNFSDMQHIYITGDRAEVTVTDTSGAIFEIRMSTLSNDFGEQVLILLLQKGRIIKKFNSLPSVLSPLH